MDEPGASAIVSILDANAQNNENERVSYITSSQMLTEIEEENQDVLTTLLQYFESVKKEKFSILESQLGVLVDLYVPVDEDDEKAGEASLEEVL